MTCCRVPVADTNRFFSRLARWHRVRHQLFGFERSQRQLIDGLRQAGVRQASLLEIGCGPGYVHQNLLRGGAATAVGVELSARMLREAVGLAERQGLSGRTRYWHGDFVDLANELDAADVTILDKVVCCYPNAEALLRESLARTRRAYALTYPRDRLITRAAVQLMSYLLKRLGSKFRPYVHNPQDIEDTVVATGFKRIYARETQVWLTQVYVRAASSHTGKRGIRAR